MAGTGKVRAKSGRSDTIRNVSLTRHANYMRQRNF
jgi:hypothetical protein